LAGAVGGTGSQLGDWDVKLSALRTAVFCCALTLTAAGTALAQSATAASYEDKVVASVDGQPITSYDIETFSASVGRPVKADDIANNPAAKAVLKALISQKLLESEVQKYSSKVDDAQVDRYIRQIEADKHMNDNQFRAALMQSGVSYADFRKQAREQLEKAVMIEQDVRSRINIPDSEIQAYYDAHKSDFMITKERYRLAQILIALPPNATPQQVAEAHAKAEKVRKEAVAGTDFAALAHKYSDDSSKNQGGELGWFEPADILDQILAAVRPLQPGQISQVVRSSHGFHILKLEAHETPGVQPLAQVKHQIRENLLDEKTRQRLQQWIEIDLAKQHDVQMLY
jgi:peptidyl-prolyl cis-trans isomerase SurA